jgi:hypothetical protein
MTVTTDKRPVRHTIKRLLWFAGLWLGGVGILGVVAWLLRLATGAP